MQFFGDQAFKVSGLGVQVVEYINARKPTRKYIETQAQ